MTYLYEQSPIQCTFGTLNPAYKLNQANFCSSIVDKELVDEIIAAKEVSEEIFVE